MAAKKKSAKKKGKLKGKKKAAFLRRMAAGRRKAARKAGKKAGKRKGSKKKASKKKKAGKRKSYRRCTPCGSGPQHVIRKRLGKNKVNNITCAVVKVGNSCRRICFTTVGKSHTKGGKFNYKAKRFLLSNQPAKGCKGKRGAAMPNVILRGIVGL